MNKERLEILLYNAIYKFAKDEYEKERILDDLDMTEKELEELTIGRDEEEIIFMQYKME